MKIPGRERISGQWCMFVRQVESLVRFIWRRTEGRGSTITRLCTKRILLCFFVHGDTGANMQQTTWKKCVFKEKE